MTGYAFRPFLALLLFAGFFAVAVLLAVGVGAQLWHACWADAALWALAAYGSLTLAGVAFDAADEE